VTLRARLTTAFLTVVLVPVLLGAFLVAATVNTVSQERATQRLDVAAGAIRTSIGALCGQLRAVAEAVAAAPAEGRSALANRMVTAGLTAGIHIDAGETADTTPGAPPPPWADCAGPDPEMDPDAVAGFEGLAARVPITNGAAAVTGTVYAAVSIDADLVRRLAEASGAQLTLLAGTGTQSSPTAQPGVGNDGDELVGQEDLDGTDTASAGTDLSAASMGAVRPPADSIEEPLPPVQSTVAPEDAKVIAGFAAHLRSDGGVGSAGNGHLVRRLGPFAGQPLPLALSLPAQPHGGTYLLLVIVVLVTAAGAVAVAWWLARTTSSPVVELAAAADRVAGGDLDARVPVRGKDEIGRLATAFNHMTRELQTYVAALTASRDQLRGHLGVLGDTLSSTHDLDRILHVILQTARHATGASAGVVLLADPSTGALVGQCAEGLDERWTIGERGTLRVPLGQGLVGSVAATGVPRLGRVERDGPPVDAGEPDCRTYVVVPFSAPGLGESTGGPPLSAARGVLALYDRLGRDEFDDGDLVTLRTFAGQAAVAVDNVRVHEEAQRLSVTDPLTGLFNYRSLRESLRREAERATRFGRKLCLLTLDLDRFKEINDGYGHAAGDAVLAEFAKRLRYEIREVDVAFRHGGEEFVVLLPETDEVGGIAVAERLCEAVRREPIVVPSRSTDGVELSVPVTVSIGIAVLPDHGLNGKAVLRAADEALYAAKAAGRNTFQVAVDPTLLCPSSGASSSPQAPRQGRGR
jgi:diguanylate cyclase (GGDEF)-like protein